MLSTSKSSAHHYSSVLGFPHQRTVSILHPIQEASPFDVGCTMCDSWGNLSESYKFAIILGEAKAREREVDYILSFQWHNFSRD